MRIKYLILMFRQMEDTRLWKRCSERREKEGECKYMRPSYDDFMRAWRIFRYRYNCTDYDAGRFDEKTGGFWSERGGFTIQNIMERITSTWTADRHKHLDFTNVATRGHFSLLIISITELIRNPKWNQDWSFTRHFFEFDLETLQSDLEELDEMTLRALDDYFAEMVISDPVWRPSRMRMHMARLSDEAWIQVNRLIDEILPKGFAEGSKVFFKVPVWSDRERITDICAQHVRAEMRLT